MPPDCLCKDVTSQQREKTPPLNYKELLLQVNRVSATDVFQMASLADGNLLPTELRSAGKKDEKKKLP